MSNPDMRSRAGEASQRPGRPKDERGIDFLRWAVKLFDASRESVTDGFTPRQLLNIAAAQAASGWDLYPDQWTPTQLRVASTWGAKRAPHFCPTCEAPCTVGPAGVKCTPKGRTWNLTQCGKAWTVEEYRRFVFREGRNQ